MRSAAVKRRTSAGRAIPTAWSAITSAISQPL
jgi:hypothetical protein